MNRLSLLECDFERKTMEMGDSIDSLSETNRTYIATMDVGEIKGIECGTRFHSRTQNG